MFKFSLAIAVSVLSVLTEVSGTCTECAPDSRVACLTDTTFDVCINSGTSLVKTGIIGSCKSGQVCTTKAGICKDPSSSSSDPSTNVEADCGSKCNECNGNFACVSKTEFALCDNGKPTTTVISCPGRQICDISAPSICAECTSEPTCSNAVYKKPDPAVDYGDTCVDKPSGYYGNIYDDTCKTYVFCQEYNGKMISILYTCAQYFDATKKNCVSKKPSGCK